MSTTASAAEAGELADPQPGAQQHLDGDAHQHPAVGLGSAQGPRGGGVIEGLWQGAVQAGQVAGEHRHPGRRLVPAPFLNAEEEHPQRAPAPAHGVKCGPCALARALRDHGLPLRSMTWPDAARGSGPLCYAAAARCRFAEPFRCGQRCSRRNWHGQPGRESDASFDAHCWNRSARRTITRSRTGARGRRLDRRPSPADRAGRLHKRHRRPHRH